jgi:ABC-type proline/glycine betaine transport system permease subunit
MSVICAVVFPVAPVIGEPSGLGFVVLNVVSQKELDIVVVPALFAVIPKFAPVEAA